MLPNFTDRSIWGINSQESFGYIEGGLPNITGSIGFSGIDPATYKGSAVETFTKSNSSGAGNDHNGSQSSATVRFNFNASLVSDLYIDDFDKVRPTSVKVRVKTRFY